MSMMRSDIFYPRDSGRLNPEYEKLLFEAESRRECPFCPGSLFDHNCRILGQTSNWLLVPNNFAYQNSAVHLLIIPRRHITEIGDISPNDWQEVQAIIHEVTTQQDSASNFGGGLVLRFGSNSGATLCHLHFHLIAPETDRKTGRSIIEKHVSFPIG